MCRGNKKKPCFHNAVCVFGSEKNSQLATRSVTSDIGSLGYRDIGHRLLRRRCCFFLCFFRNPKKGSQHYLDLLVWCLIWKSKKKLPNSGLMVIYHGKEWKYHLKQIQDCKRIVEFPFSKSLLRTARWYVWRLQRCFCNAPMCFCCYRLTFCPLVSRGSSLNNNGRTICFLSQIHLWSREHHDGQGSWQGLRGLVGWSSGSLGGGFKPSEEY